jgi:bifunctional DNA-binding transcriptional regulator/antitoxin component of YhaV-PrlF toxin-antitoxin module
MSKVTAKLRVTVPKHIADRYGMRPGSEISWPPAGDALREVPGAIANAAPDPAERLSLFDAATERQRKRQRRRVPSQSPKNRGWTRKELYERDRPH